MANINIPFNNNTYSVDESSLSSAMDSLKSHFSTVMNGSGATVALDGTSYGIDSTKLADATSAFVAHLGTVAGSGTKVIVGGVEYNVDSTKMSDAIAQLEAVLGNLSSDGDESGDESDARSEYGFYYNRVYMSEDNTMAIIVDEEYANVFIYDNGTLVLSSVASASEFSAMIDAGMATVSDDGKEVSMVIDGYDSVFVITDNDYHSIYFGRTYSYTDIDTNTYYEYIFDESGTVTGYNYDLSNNGELDATNEFTMNAYGDFAGTLALYSTDAMSYMVSMDGTYISLHNISDSSIVLMELKLVDDTYNQSDITGVAAGLYETGSNYTVLKTSWADLLADGTIHVENGVVYTNCDMETGENSSAATLNGDLMLPDDGSVTAIGNYVECEDGTYSGNLAFTSCAGLTGVYITNSVTFISYMAFGMCTGLNEVYMSNSVISIGGGAFYGCTSLTRVTIPSRVTTLNSDFMFAGCANLTSVVLHDHVVSIGTAFAGCLGLKSIGLVGSGASIEIPDSVTSISDDAFIQCTGLETVTWPNGVDSIEDGMFDGCTNLTMITIGKNVTSIGAYIAHDCPALIQVKYDGSMSDWNAISGANYTWGNASAAITVVCSDGLVYIPVDNS